MRANPRVVVAAARAANRNTVPSCLVAMVATPSSRGASPYLMACPAAALLIAYAILNGVPFIYPDSLVYLAYGTTAWEKVASAVPDVPWIAGGSSPAEAVPAATVPGPPDGVDPVAPDEDWAPVAGRSLYYGVLAALPGPLPVPWTGVALQAYCGALAIALAWRTAIGRAGAGYLASVGMLGMASTFGIFAGTAMPDVWAAIGILSVGVLLAGRERIDRIDGVVLWSLVLFSALAHSTHLAVLAALTVLCALARVVGISTLGWPVLARMVAVVAATVALEAGARSAMERAAGLPAQGLPFLTAHLVDGGPGTAFVRDRCPGSGFAICEQADALPVEWRHFLFRIAAPDAYRSRLAAEDTRFALAVLRHDPAAVVGLALRDAARQVAMIGLGTTPIRAAIGERGALETSTSPVADEVREGRLYEAGWFYDAVSRSNAAAVLIGLVALAGVAALPGRDHGGPGSRVLSRLLTVVLSGLLLNAAICGILASPYDRFQARVAWLIPFLAILAVSARARATAPTTFPAKELDHELR